MAIDSQRKRRRMLAVRGMRRNLPMPDSVIGPADRHHLLGLFGPAATTVLTGGAVFTKTDIFEPFANTDVAEIFTKTDVFEPFTKTDVK